MVDDVITFLHCHLIDDTEDMDTGSQQLPDVSTLQGNVQMGSQNANFVIL